MTDAERSRGARAGAAARKVVLIVFVNLVIVGVLLALLEGAASLLFIGNEIVRAPGIPEDNHAEYDPLLGWANRPSVLLEDFYGPGAHVQTNAQGFRNREEFPRHVPPNRLRIICSGDSFTFGYGVALDDVWCERLRGLDPRIETVNMGLGGYGVDQAYLWYKRDGVTLEHDFQILAFLTDDFHRMRSDRFMGYGRPLLDVRNDSLVVTNLPVPRTSWLTRQRALHGETVSRLNIVQLVRRVLPADEGAAQAARAQADERVRAVVARIFADLHATNVAKQSRLVLVYLPGFWDYAAEPNTDAWRAFVRTEAERLGVPYFDLVEEIRLLPAGQVDALYAPNAHFSAAGNAWAADVLGRRLEPLLLHAPAGAAP